MLDFAFLRKEDLAGIRSSKCRLHCERVHILFFAYPSGNHPLFYNFRSWTCKTQPRPVPLPPLCILLTTQIQGREHPHQDHSPEYQSWRSWCFYNITHTLIPPTTNLSPPLHFPLLMYPLPPVQSVGTRKTHVFLDILVPKVTRYFST
jgi:hypothetical protein